MKPLIKFKEWMDVIEKYNNYEMNDAQYLSFLEDHQLNKYVLRCYNNLDNLQSLVMKPAEDFIGCSIQICCLFYNTMLLEQRIAELYDYYILADKFQEYAYELEEGDSFIPDLLDKRTNEYVEVKLKQTYSKEQIYWINYYKMQSDIDNKNNSIKHSHTATKFIYGILDGNFLAELHYYDLNKDFQKPLNKRVDCNDFKKWWNMKKS